MKNNIKNARNLAFGLMAVTSFTGVANAASLTTTFVGGNGQDGNMFDIVVLGPELTVTSLELNLDVASNVTVEVYGRVGTWVGFDTSSAGWTLLSSNSVTSTATGVGTFVDVTDFTLPSSATYALYVTTTGTGVNYSNGTAVGDIEAQNSDLQILEGAGKEYAFGSTFEPRVWNGTINYEVFGVVPEPSSTALLGLGGVALLLRRRKA
ncbi:MAG: PEP-CTERM sorting domain-containing protein [Akkermansiaceae bacterium]